MARDQDFMVDVRTGTPVVGIPASIGKYRIIGQLGRGGMADLYLGVALGIGGFSRLHVLKLVRADCFDNADALQMFINEARVTALLNHPNIVQTHEVAEDNGIVFMVMEYLDGQSLDVILSQVQRRGTSGGVDMGMRMRLRIVADVLNGLHHAHELKDLEGQPINLVHRDVTPHNIFVTYDGGIKLLDFGVAKATSASSPTRVGTIKGKVAYMAPEQVNNPGKVSRATDLFQIGLVLWEGVIGRTVWQGLSEYEVLLKLSSNAALPFEPPPGADPELVRICRRATALAPEDRYATAEEFNRDLEAFMVDRDIRVTAKQVGTYVAGLFEQRRNEVREAIQRRLKDIQGESSGAAGGSGAVFGPVILGGPGRTGSGSEGSSGTGGSRASSVPRPTVAPVPEGAPGGARQPHPAWRNTAIGAVLLAASLVGAVLALAVSPRKTAEVAQVAVPASPAPVEQKVERVQVFIEATPSHARIYLDNGLLVSNPFSGSVPRDGSVHVVRAEADGYETSSQVVQFERDARHVLKLAERKAVVVGAVQPTLPASSPKRNISHARAPSSVRQSARQSGQAPEAKGAQESAPSIRLDNSDPWK